MQPSYTSPLEALEASIHRVIRTIEPENYYRICHITSILGAFALSRLTGHEWVAGAGDFAARTTEDLDDPYFIGMDSSNIPDQLAKGKNLEFHCWNMLTDMPKGSEVRAHNQQRLIIVDFTARWWPELCAAHGDRWDRRVEAPLVGHPIDLMGLDYWYTPAGIYELVIKPNMQAGLEAAGLWWALRGHYGLDDPAFGGELMIDIFRRCNEVGAQARQLEAQTAQGEAA